MFVEVGPNEFWMSTISVKATRDDAPAIPETIVGGISKWLKSSTKVAPKSDVVRVRMNSGLSQTQLAAAFGVSKRTLEQWEQGRREGTDKLTTSDAKKPFDIHMQQPRCSTIQMHAADGIGRTPPIPGGAVN